VRRIAKRLEITPDFPGNAAAIQEFFILQGISLGITFPAAAKVILGPEGQQSAIADNIGGIIYRRPVAASGVASAARALAVPKNEAAPQPNSNWALLCPECPAGNQGAAIEPAAAAATGSVAAAANPPVKKKKKWWKIGSKDSAAQAPAEPPAFAYSIEFPCSSAMTTTFDQINQELAGRGLWADKTPKTRAIQIFIRPATAAK